MSKKGDKKEGKMIENNFAKKIGLPFVVPRLLGGVETGVVVGSIKLAKKMSKHYGIPFIATSEKMYKILQQTIPLKKGGER